ncbi:MAG TPA: DNA translocase FtsK 4TM domain-containing protein, partial [Aquabacterium sp.]|nr:DNA translocase FtsK 4TM domain-containing protein [Aquabacterium sp.]
MTYSLNTLTNPTATASPARSNGAGRFAHEFALVLGGAGLLFWLLALVSYSAHDPAFSTSGTGGPVANWGGRLGAWLADGSYFLLGFSAWWCFAAGVRAWLATLARWMRAGEPAPAAPQGLTRSRLAFWLGLAVLLIASTGLEWSRLYRFEARLPDHAGGALGYLMGPLGMKWLGFTGSGLVFVALVVVSAAVVFRFSWAQAAERLGARVDGFFEARREKREIAQDLAFGQQAARQREEIVLEERIEIEEHHPTPVLIEPVIVDVPKSERVAKERQKPLFTELPDSKLPQVDLLDGPQGRQETVSPETLEMTSRLIEKKLKDFGVEVRVVLAQPGPVITRYEIEPATGVKG